MVTVKGYTERINEDSKVFFTLELHGGLQMVKSKETGNFYATMKSATISSTFDEDTCKSLIGTKIPGSIIKQHCEPYDYVIKETGEEITLHHRWIYTPEENVPVEHKTTEIKQGNIKADVNQFSQNGAFAGVI